MTSTQDVVTQFSRLEGTLLAWADTQESGRGRRGRTWHSRPGGLYYSFHIPDHAQFSSMVWALITADRWISFLQGHVSDLPLSIKWPNDLVCEGRKFGGILSESTETGIAIGVGININNDPESNQFLRRPATSLSRELGRTCSRRELLFGWCEQFAGALEAPPELSRLENKIDTIGNVVKSERGVGEAIGLCPDGSLELKTADGKSVRVYDNELQQIKKGTS